MKEMKMMVGMIRLITEIFIKIGHATDGYNTGKCLSGLVNPFSKAIFAWKSPILECKKTCWSNPLVRHPYYCQSIPGLFNEFVAALYF